jgi:carbonic anhydrase
LPIELLFDQSIGHIFVTRIAGNIAASEIIASLEYGAVVLGTKVILVMGHGGCGAVKATIDAKEVPGQISSILIYSLRLIKGDQILKRQSRLMPKFRQPFCANPRRSFPVW